MSGDTVWPVPNTPPEPQAEPADSGRQFTGQRKVRLGDVTPTGVLRLDALTRYTQDVSDDDTTDAGLPTEPAWVVRRTTVDVLCPASLAETLSITTFCSGLGRRWAERRLRIIGSGGGHYEVSTLWICIDPVTGRPHQLTNQFHQLYGEAAAGREVKARLTNPKLDPAATSQPWPLRLVDFDTLGHVNNAAYWAVVEEALAPASMKPPPSWGPVSGERDVPYRVHLEYSAGLRPDDDVTIALSVNDDGTLGLWWLTGPEPVLAASGLVIPLPSAPPS